MNRKIIILLILAGFPIYSCKVTKYQASNQRNHITKPMLRPPKKGSGQSRCLVTLNEEAPGRYPNSAFLMCLMVPQDTNTSQ